MAGWELLVGTAALQYYSTVAMQHYSTADCSTTIPHRCRKCLKPSSARSIVTSVNNYQLKRKVTVHSGTADPSSAVLWLWAIVPFVIIPVRVDWDRVNRG